VRRAEQQVAYAAADEERIEAALLGERDGLLQRVASASIEAFVQGADELFGHGVGK
jgi:hypothetical protein